MWSAAGVGRSAAIWIGGLTGGYGGRSMLVLAVSKLTEDEHMSGAMSHADLGPCTRYPCDAPAVVLIVLRPCGPSARLTIYTGEKAAALTASLPEAFTGQVCADHAHDALDDLLISRRTVKGSR